MADTMGPVSAWIFVLPAPHAASERRKKNIFFSGAPGRLGESGGTKIGVGTGPIVSAMKIYTTLKKISTKTVHYEKS